MALNDETKAFREISESARRRMLNRPDITSIIDFIDNVVQIVQGAFVALHTQLATLATLLPGDFQSAKFGDVRRHLMELKSREHFDQIGVCAELRKLRDHYSNSINPAIKGQVDDMQEWREPFWKLDEREGWIVELTSQSLRRLDTLFAASLKDEAWIDQVQQTALEIAGSVATELRELDNVRIDLLHKSGYSGLNAILSPKKSEVAPPQRPAHASPWSSGSFFLFALIVIMAAGTVLANYAGVLTPVLLISRSSPYCSSEP